MPEAVSPGEFVRLWPVVLPGCTCLHVVATVPTCGSHNRDHQNWKATSLLIVFAVAFC